MTEQDVKPINPKRSDVVASIKKWQVGLILTIVMQCLAGIIWGTTVTNDLGYLKEKAREQKVDTQKSISDLAARVTRIENFFYKSAER